MTNRDWFCLALRVFGIWALLQGVDLLVPNLMQFINIRGGNAVHFIPTLLWLTGRTAIGLVLLLFAPAIAIRFYPNPASTETTCRVDEAKLLKIGIQLLAVYALLLAFQSGATVVGGLWMSDEDFDGVHPRMDFYFSDSAYIASMFSLGLNLAFAAILLMWNEHVVAFIQRNRYVPERDAREPPPNGD